MSFAKKTTTAFIACQIAVMFSGVAWAVPATADVAADEAADTALEEGISATPIDPKVAARAEMFFAKGHKALDAKNLAAAESFYQKAVELNPNEGRYHRQLAIVFAKMMKGQRAEREALIAQSIDPEDWRTKLILGTIYHLEKRIDEEVAVYKKVLVLLPPEQAATKAKLEAFIAKDEATVKRLKEAAARRKEADENKYKNVY
jgi:Flp pilus assembly protein TadD